MADIRLTDADMMDLRAGHTINAMAEDGSEHVLRGGGFTIGVLAKLERGGIVRGVFAGVEVDLRFER